jgi:hypothetical protein
MFQNLKKSYHKIDHDLRIEDLYHNKLCECGCAPNMHKTSFYHVHIKIKMYKKNFTS